MNNITSLFEYTFFNYALIGILLVNIVCALTGTYIVAKRLVFISGGIAHASFGGIGIGYYLGIHPFLGGIVFAVFSALGIEYTTEHGKVRSDSVIAAFWTLGMALGILFISLVPGFTPDLITYLFGDIMAISSSELIMEGVLSAILILFFAIYYYPILYVAFDEEFAKVRKLPVQTIRYIMIVFISLTIVLSVRVAGIILALSLMTMPQETANVLTSNFLKMILLSFLFGVIACLIGLFVSFGLNMATGPIIIIVLVLQFLLVKGLKLLIKKIG